MNNFKNQLLNTIDQNEILKKKLLKNKNFNKISILLISNVVIDNIKEYLKNFFLNNNINIQININPLNQFYLNQSNKSSKYDLIFVFWEIDSFIEDFMPSNKQISPKSIFAHFKKNLNLFNETLSSNQKVIFNLMYSKINNYFFNKKKENLLTTQLINNFLKSSYAKKYNLVNTEEIFFREGLHNLVDLRNYYLFKMLYKDLFYISYISNIKNLLMKLIGNIKKVLILDCDNTLWRGILSEDGQKKISITKNLNERKIFNFVHRQIIEISKKGVIICLCTKNDEKVLLSYLNSKKIILNRKHFTIIKSNWKNKFENILSISKELNLPTNSFVFLDDSNHELELIRKKIPDILLYKTPINNIWDYPKIFSKIKENFNLDNVTKEDLSKKNYYVDEFKRKKIKDVTNNINDFINSLKIKIKVYSNDLRTINRMAQLTQKTNQFNSSLKRKTENEILNDISSKKYGYYAIEIFDKFGSSGISSVIIFNKKNLTIENYSLSCRVFGRKIENYILSHFIKKIIKKNIKLIYFKGPKNHLVLSFLNNLNLKCIKKIKNITFFIPKNYEDSDIKNIKIRVENGKKTSKYI